MMNSDLLLGTVGMSSLSIRPGDTAVASSISDLPVISTSSLIGLVESACSAALAEYFEPGETSSTVDIQLSLLSGVGVGNEIRAYVTCVDVQGPLLEFSAEINHEARLIATATVHRKVVDRVSFMARTAAEGMLAEKKTP